MKFTHIFLSPIFSAVLLATSASAVANPILDLKMAKEFDVGVQLAVSAKESATGTGKTLILAGEGLRTKKVSVLHPKVYVAQFFAEHPEAMVRTEEGALASLDKVGAIALRLSFIRSVDAETVQNSFREGLNANDIDPTEADIAQFLSVVKNGGDLNDGTSLTILGYKKDDGTEVIAYEDPAGTVTQIAGQKGFINKIMAIWFKESADIDLETLKSRLLKVPAVTAAN